MFLHNYYKSYDLATKLLSRATYCIGTLQLDRKQNSVDVKNTKLKKRESVARKLDGIMVEKWRDKREVPYISSEYNSEIVSFQNRRNQEKEKSRFFSI